MKIKNSEKLLYTTILILSTILILNIFLINFINEYVISAIFGITSFILIMTIGYEKDNHPNKRQLIITTLFYTVSYIILQYGLGLYVGYVKSTYSYRIITIIRNIIPTILYILSSELLRYELCKKGEKRKSIIILVMILFLLADVSIGLNIYNLANNREYFEMLTLVFFPGVMKNIVLTLIATRYGLTINIVYRLILEIYMFLLPIMPDINIYLQSVLQTLYPVILYYIIKNSIERKSTEIRNKKAGNIISIILISIMLIIICLNSNLFRYWIAVIGSGSMEPTINVGDAIIIDKSYQNKIEKLKVGDVIVFKVKDEMYTHRIIRIEENNSIYTKGDRKGNVEDNWIVKETDIIGLVKYKISYIGYPSLWIKQIMEE